MTTLVERLPKRANTLFSTKFTSLQSYSQPCESITQCFVQNLRHQKALAESYPDPEQPKLSRSQLGSSLPTGPESFNFRYIRVSVRLDTQASKISWQ